jgi:uncharacterized protein (DUF1697 family)
LTTYIAFLRAVNVGGHAIVKMEALGNAFTASRCHNVRTYIQSGNVVFESSAGEPQFCAIFRTNSAVYWA